VLPDLLYSGPRSGAFAADNTSDGPAIALLRSSFGTIDQNTLFSVANELATSNNNLLDVVYGIPAEPDRSAELGIWVEYANGDQQAIDREAIYINMQDYLP
jgi:hypothetical protein